MITTLVRDLEPVTLVGGGGFGADDLTLARRHAPLLVAADGGANDLAAMGHTPAAVIGDLDSLTDDTAARLHAVLHRVQEQDTTDFEKCLTRIDAPLVLAVGFTGGRLDHTLSTLNTMARHHDRAVILIGSDDISFLVPRPKVQLDLPVGTRLSIMPLADVRIDTEGLRWPVRDAAYHPTGAVSISNEVAQEQVTIQTNGPVLVTLAQAGLVGAITAVRARSHKARPPR